MIIPTIRVEAKCGDHINDVACVACETANRRNRPVEFRFNGVELVVLPRDTPAEIVARWNAAQEASAQAYRESDEGKRSAIKAARRLLDAQARTEALLAELPGVARSMDALVAWLVKLSDAADHIGVLWHPGEVADAIEAAGWMPSAEVGRKPEEFTTRDMIGRYVIGQAIECLRNGMPPHPVIRKFADEYEAKSS